MKTKLLTTIVLFTLTLGVMAVNPPGVINHQGRITVNGTNYNGTGYFKFAFVNATGTTSYWSNDETSIAGAEPDDSVSVTVEHGHYALGLGDTALGPNMLTIPPSVFTDNAEVYLRIWFAQSVSGPFEVHSPDRRITSAGYALSSREAQTVANNAITAGNIADGAITSQKLASGVAGENIDAAGSLGIGLGGNDPRATIQLDGDIGFIDAASLGQAVHAAGGFNFLDGAYDVFVVGTTAYVASLDSDSLTIIDVSNPAAPSVISEIVDGVGGFNALEGAISVFVENNIAFVASLTDNSLTLIDVSNPASPTLIAEIINGSGGFNALEGARSVSVDGSTAYVASLTSNSLTIIDVSTPAAPSLLVELVHNTD